MNLDQRVDALLADVPLEDRHRLRDVKWMATFLGISTASVYRLASSGALSFVKLPGATRTGGRGRAGSLRFRLADAFRFLAEREVGAVVTESPVSPARVERDLRRLAG